MRRSRLRPDPRLRAAACLSLVAAASTAGAWRHAAAHVDQAGTYVLADTWASRPGDLPPDAWRYAAGIDVGPDGRVFVADRDAARLTVIEPDEAVRLLVPTPGYDDGLVRPGHLAADGAAGRLYVADPGAGAVAVFDLAGARVATWPDVPDAAGVAVLAGGDVAVGLGGTGEVARFAADGTRVATWPVVAADGSPGRVRGVAADANGRVYVVDGREPTVHVVDAGGRVTDRIRVGVSEGEEITDVAVDDRAGASRPNRYFVATSRGVLWQDAGSGNPWRIAPTGPAFGVALDARYGIFATAPGRPGDGSRVARLPWSYSSLIIPDKLWGTALLQPGALDMPEVVEVGADGAVYLLDRGSRVQKFSPDGASVAQVDRVTNPVRVAAGPDGTVYVTDGANVTAYTQGPGGWARAWNTPVAPPGRDDSQGAGLVYDAVAGAVVVLDSEQDRLRAFTPAGGRGAATPLRPAGDDSTVWVDLAVDAGGSLYALDRTNRTLHVVAPGGGAARQVVLPDPARHIAVGPAGDVFTLDRDGWVRRYDVSAGAAVRTAAFDATRFDAAAATSPSSLAVDAAAEVLVTDCAAHLVSRFTWDPGATPSDPPSGADPTCRGFPDKTADPGRVDLGDPVAIRLTVRGGCGAGASNTPRDIVLILDVSGSMAGEKIRILREAAVSFVSDVDFATSRVGVVSFTDRARVEQGLSANANAVRTAIRALDADPDGGTAVDEGLREARQHWSSRRRPEAKAVFILMSDGSSSLDQARAEASLAKQAGVEIFTIGIQAWRTLMMAVATSPSHFFEADSARFLYGIFERIAERVTTSILFGSATVTDRIPANMRFVPGSDAPPAAFDGATNTLTWRLADVPFNGFALTFAVEPQAVGDWPTNAAAWADYVDGLGASGRLDFPVPRVRVDAVPPTPTPTSAPPTATRTRTATPTTTIPPSVTASATPTRTATPRPTAPPRPIFVPLALAEKPCVPTDGRADVLLVIDTSTSMTGAKLDAAKAAALAFVDLLRLPADQAGVVGFNTDAALASPLTGDRAALRGAIAGLATAPGTRIDRGLEVAFGELAGPRHRTGSARTVVLLTDGRQEDGAARAIDLALAARGTGVVIFAIGLGGDVDVPFIEAIAGSLARTFLAPGPADLGRIYARIAPQVPCPPEVYWGRRGG